MSTTWSEAMVLLRSRDRASSLLLAVRKWPASTWELGLEESRHLATGLAVHSISFWAQKRLKEISLS